MRFATPVCLTLLSLAGAPAFAADFTFEVPVRIENVVRGEMAMISCFVSAQPTTGAQRASSAQIIGREAKQIMLTDGAFRGTVVIEVSAVAPRRANEAKSYTCYIATIGGRAETPGGRNYAVSLNNADTAYAAATGRRIERKVMEASGPLP